MEKIDIIYFFPSLDWKPPANCDCTFLQLITLWVVNFNKLILDLWSRSSAFVAHLIIYCFFWLVIYKNWSFPVICIVSAGNNASFKIIALLFVLLWNDCGINWINKLASGEIAPELNKQFLNSLWLRDCLTN